jgi:Carboxypeptidase regulatory-like domain/TonB-dependent Receptor Plug Domain
MTSRRRAVSTSALVTALLIGTVPHVRGQGNTSSIRGTVVDEQRLPIPSAAIRIEDVDGGLRRSLQAGQDGSFELAALQPGDYALAVEAAGFQPKQVRVRVEINQRVRLDVTLSTKARAESVEVVNTTPLLHVNDAAVGSVVDEHQVAKLPLNGRQFLELALLVPGVHTSHGAQTGTTSALYWRPGQNSAVSISGGRPNSNTYLLDGTTNTDPAFNTYVISLPPDSIREFQIQTGTYTAELGGAGTGQVNVVTKSGTNTLHGTVYEYLRNSAFDARLFTSPEELPHFSQNQFGGTLGGPLRTDRTHYFVGYEGFRSTQRQSMILSVPLESWRRGDFGGSAPIYDPASAVTNPAFDPARPESPTNPRLLRQQFPNNQIPAGRMNPVARTILDQFVPLPNLSGSENNYLDTRAQRLTADQFNVRLDHSFAGGSSVFGRYSFSKEDGFTPENLPGFGADHDNKVQNLTLTSINPLTSRFVSELRVGFQKMRLHRLGEKANGVDLVTQLGIPGVGFGGPEAYGLPRFNVQGLDPFGDSLLCTPCQYSNSVYQLGEHVTWLRGRHSLKLGGDVRYFKWDMLGFFQNRGFFSFTPGFTTRTATNDGTGNALASFLLGLPVIAQRQAGLPSMNMRQTAFDAFVQDDWRISNHLTVNVGLRYEFKTSLHDVKKVLTNLDFIDGQPWAYVGGQAGYPEGLAFADKNNLAPRFGLAYAPGSGKNVFRAGAGIFYSYSDMNLWCNQVHNVPLVFPQIIQSNNFVPSITGFGFAPPVLGTTRVAFTTLDPHAPTPRITQASATFERQLGPSTMVQAGYLGAWGRNLDRAVLVNNAPTPSSAALQARRPYQTISFVPGTVLPPDFANAGLTFPVGPINRLVNNGRSEYNAGWLLAKRTFTNGLSFLANYTYARSYSDAPAFRSPAMESEVPQDSYDLAAEWGRDGCDIRHRFVTSVLYKIPFTTGGAAADRRWLRRVFGDWEVAMIYQAQSGFPYTIGVVGDTANVGALLNVNPIRANVVPGVDPDLPGDQRSADRWFNTDAFTTPPAFTFGNAGRNTMTGPSLHKVDVALEKRIPTGGDKAIVFRTEVFNLFNHTNLGIPNRFVNTPQFGTITEAATSARQIQFVLRYVF